MSHEWSDALQWRGNKSLESSKVEEDEKEEKRANYYELINDKIFVYRCNTCLLVFTCVHSFSNHVLSENHQIKQLNALKKGKYFNCLRCKYVCLSLSKIISHIELYNHCHNILRKIKRNMVYNGIASCSCRVKCYTFYSQNKNCLTTGDPILAEYEGVPNFQSIDEGGMCPYDHSDSHHRGDVQFLPKGEEIPPKERNLLLMGPSNDIIPLFDSAPVWRGNDEVGKSLRRKTLGFILSTTGGEACKKADGAAYKETDAAHLSHADANMAPMPCNPVGEQTELIPICTDINKINDFNELLLNLEKQEKKKKQGLGNEENSCSTDPTRNLLLHIYENNYHMNKVNRNDSLDDDADRNDKKCDVLEETESQLFLSPYGLNNDNACAEKNYDPFRSYGYNPFEEGGFSLFPKEENVNVGTGGGLPQSDPNSPDRKDTIGTSTNYNALHEEGPSYLIGAGSKSNICTQNRTPNYDPILKDHHNVDQFLSLEQANKIDKNITGEIDQVKSSFVRSIHNSAKKLAALDTLFTYEQREEATLFCSDPSTAYRNTNEAQTNVGDQIDTHPNGAPSGIHFLHEEQMGGFHNGHKFTPSEEDFKKYFCKNFLPHIFDYQTRGMVPTMEGAQKADSENAYKGNVDSIMGDTHWDARQDMRVVNSNMTNNMAEWKTPHKGPFIEMDYPAKERATDAAPYLSQTNDNSDAFLSSKYWQPKMDEMNNGSYKHVTGTGSCNVSGEGVGATNEMSYMKYKCTVGKGEHNADSRSASLFPQLDTTLTYTNKKKNENVTEDREEKKQLDLLTFYPVHAGRSPYIHSDVKNEGTNANVQNGEGDTFYPQLNKASHHFNQPYEDLIHYGKCFRGWAVQEEKPRNRNDETPSFTATTGDAYREVGNPNAQSDASRQVVVTKGMSQLCGPSSSGADFNARRLSLPSRHTSVGNPTKNAESPTQEQILNNIFEDSSDDKKYSRTPSETAALNQKRQSFINEIEEIKKSIEKENKNNKQPNVTHTMSPPCGQRMEPGIPLHGEEHNFCKSRVMKKENFDRGSCNNGDIGAYPNFTSIRSNDYPGTGAHAGIPAEGGNFGSGYVQSGHFHNGYFQSSGVDDGSDNRLHDRLNSRRNHFSRAHQERKKSTDGENGQRFISNLSKWQSRR
ncbi:hypothetical protein AK88_01966 [Plasmodium fragile]|uniref:C2H2-type domain-containing protein n=1 Tax=Plasmodium fragile TaxID=5857 RepID=A0A0D9QMN9_PLAFR|nr:uncharacterized protein AK88_01966 [Plasmodium fragile]KJP88350.1 hypothetical protein AK88_01966 [Plasmodium fragile]